MSAQPNFRPRFIRKTQLAANEYHKNFFKLDREILAGVTSEEADKVTPLMSKVYLRLVNAPVHYWEREGVLRFEAEQREGKQVKAWEALCEIVGVASATARKALWWMHEQGIIGYFSGKNGVGIRIFLNHAVASIGVRKPATGQKILHFAPASTQEAQASSNETAFNDSYAVSEVSDSDLNSHAPKNGADVRHVVETPLKPSQPLALETRAEEQCAVPKVQTFAPSLASTGVVNELVERLKDALEPCVKSTAVQAARQTSAQEMARTREWFETKALPKAVRVAQHETYHLIRKHGPSDHRARSGRSAPDDGCHTSGDEKLSARPLTPEEIREIAEGCVAFLEVQGRSIESMLDELSVKHGGCLIPEDTQRVRQAVQAMLHKT